MTAYYNEVDSYAAIWLRNLISAGHIPPGDVDERDIRNLRRVIMLDPNEVDKKIKKGFGFIIKTCHADSVNAGWWKDIETGEEVDKQALVPEKLCLIHSEISEAMEGHRKDLMDDKLPHRKMIEVELADAVIRIADLAGALGLDVGGAIAEKRAFNATRPDHKLENRKKANGKKF